MTFKDLQRLVESERQEQPNPKLEKLTKRLRGRGFWIWSPTDHKRQDRFHHGNCCLNHIVGLPRKDGKRKPLFDYEHQLYRALMEPTYLNSAGSARPSETSPNVKVYNIMHPFQVKHIAVLKAAGLGITEFVLRFIAWLCLRNSELQGTQMIVFTGPRLELAISLIERLKGLFLRHGITFTDKETVCNLNGVRIEAFPSHHASTARGLPNVSLVFVDEASFIPDSEAGEIMDIMLRYVPKSDPYLIAVSTPNKPGDLMDEIFRQLHETVPFKRLRLEWTYGLGKIYSQQEIDKVKSTRSFEREFCLKFAGLEGNVFSQQSIDRTMQVHYDPDRIVREAKKSIGVDVGFGSSKFAIVATQLVDGKIQIVHAQEYDRPDFDDMVNEVYDLAAKKLGHVTNIYVDAAAPAYWQALKREFQEPYDQNYLDRIKADCKKFGTRIENRPAGRRRAVPSRGQGHAPEPALAPGREGHRWEQPHSNPRRAVPQPYHGTEDSHGRGIQTPEGADIV